MKTCISHHLALASGKIKISSGSALTSLHREQQEIMFDSSELRELVAMVQRTIDFRDSNQTSESEDVDKISATKA